MKNKGIIPILIIVLITLILSGCTDFLIDGSTTYQSHSTRVSYTLNYGYKVNCTSSDEFEHYEITYDCDVPEALNGQIVSTVANDNSYENKTLATFNVVKSWDIHSNENKEYTLGITASVVSESYNVADLNGANALSIADISSSLVDQYCQAQSTDTTTYIDPNNPNIKAKANEIYNIGGTNNSFLVAKELFIWLKQQTAYRIHLTDSNVQPAGDTFLCKTGDCDDLSFLYISLCRSLGIPARFIRGFLIEVDTATPHAWVEVYVGGGVGNNGWIPVECAGISSNAETEVNQNFAIESADHLRLFMDDGSNESINISMSGLSYVTYGDMIVEATYYSEVTDYTVLRSNELVIDEDGIRSYK